MSERPERIIPEEDQFEWAKQIGNLQPSGEPTAQLDPRDRPVNLEYGQELYRQTAEAVAIFRLELLPDLPIGDATRQALTNLLDQVTSPTGMNVYDSDIARLVRYEEVGEDRVVNEYGVPELEISPTMMDATKRWLQEAEQKSGVTVPPEIKPMLAAGWLVWHEMGHALEAAYAEAADPLSASEWGSARPSKAELHGDSFAWGVSQKMTENEALNFINRTVEAERFAEGFGQMMVEKYAVLHGMEPTQAHQLRQHLVPDDRLQRAKLFNEVVTSSANDATSDRYTSDLKAASAKLGKPVSPNAIGYAEPYDDDHLRRIMELTGRLEGMSWQNRLRQREDGP